GHADVGRVLGAEHTDPTVACRLPDRVGRLDDLSLLLDTRRPHRAPLLPRPDALLICDHTLVPLLEQAQEEPACLRLDDQRPRGLVTVVEMPMDRVRMHDDEVALLPVVARLVVDLVAPALEDVEDGFVLVAVTVVRGAWWQLDEVDLEALGEERLVSGGDPPPGAGMCGRRRVRDR